MEFTIYGGVAIMFSLITFVTGALMIWIALFGGEIKFVSEGFVPKIKRWRQQKGG